MKGSHNRSHRHLLRPFDHLLSFGVTLQVLLLLACSCAVEGPVILSYFHRLLSVKFAIQSVGLAKASISLASFLVLVHQSITVKYVL